MLYPPHISLSSASFCLCVSASLPSRRSYVAKLEGVHIVVRGGAGDAIPGDGGPGLDVQQNDPGSAPPTQGSGSSTGGGGAGNAGRQHEER